LSARRYPAASIRKPSMKHAMLMASHNSSSIACSHGQDGQTFRYSNGETQPISCMRRIGADESSRGQGRSKADGL
jgi:hypothetical protein